MISWTFIAVASYSDVADIVGEAASRAIRAAAERLCGKLRLSP
jgi:hypothetical protein